MSTGAPRRSLGPGSGMGSSSSLKTSTPPCCPTNRLRHVFRFRLRQSVEAWTFANANPEHMVSRARAVPQRGESGRIDNSAICARQRVYCRHVRAIQLKVEYRQVLHQPIDPGGPRKRDNPALLHKPPQDNLGDGLVTAGRDLLERWVREDTANRHAAVSCHGKPRLQRTFDEHGLVQIRMVFELIRHKRRGRESDSLRHECAVEIADADMPNLAGACDCIESLDLFGGGAFEPVDGAMQRLDA